MGRYLFPTAMGAMVVLILCGLGMPLWAAIASIGAAAFTAYAQCRSRQASEPACADCGKLYCDFPMDTVLPHDQWQAINGAHEGLLCANCIIERGARLPGVIGARLRLKFADEFHDTPDSPNA